jgi:hypothetical protein
MPINKGETAFTGTQGGVCGYISHGINIMRTASSLTSERVEKDPAFAGFRQSGKRMQEAAPVASALYNQIPKEIKQFRLYRVLTGEVLNMMKQGIDKPFIIKKLQRQYIDPLLKQPAAGYGLIPTQTPLSTNLAGFVYAGRVKGFRKLKTWKRPSNT